MNQFLFESLKPLILLSAYLPCPLLHFV